MIFKDEITYKNDHTNETTEKNGDFVAKYQFQMQVFFSLFIWEHDPTPRIGNFRDILDNFGKGQNV